jgi:hypothetical protein
VRGAVTPIVQSSSRPVFSLTHYRGRRSLFQQQAKNDHEDDQDHDDDDDHEDEDDHDHDDDRMIPVVPASLFSFPRPPWH